GALEKIAEAAASGRSTSSPIKYVVLDAAHQRDSGSSESIADRDLDMRQAEEFKRDIERREDQDREPRAAVDDQPDPTEGDTEPDLAPEDDTEPDLAPDEDDSDTDSCPTDL